MPGPNHRRPTVSPIMSAVWGAAIGLSADELSPCPRRCKASGDAYPPLSVSLLETAKRAPAVNSTPGLRTTSSGRRIADRRILTRLPSGISALLPQPAPRVTDHRASDGVNMAACWPEKAAAVHRERACERARLFAEDLFHRLALGELVDEFVEIADLAHHRLQCR